MTIFRKNKNMIELFEIKNYCDCLGFGKSILGKVEKGNWCSSIVEELSKDLKKEFPNKKGFSIRNLFSMKNGLISTQNQK